MLIVRQTFSLSTLQVDIRSVARNKIQKKNTFIKIIVRLNVFSRGLAIQNLVGLGVPHGHELI